MRIDLSSNIDEVIGWTARLSPQFEFAAAKALTDTAAIVKRGMPEQAEADLDRPVPFTKSGFYMQAARKTRLMSVVGVKDKQAQYLGYQVEGGMRAPTRKALRLPSVVELNAYGNVPLSLVRTLIARANAGRRVTKGQAKRFGISRNVELFYGDPADGRPAGIYKRVVLNSTRHQLIPIVVFPQQSASYERRFDFYGYAQRTTLREFGPALARAWSLALATAK